MPSSRSERPVWFRTLAPLALSLCVGQALAADRDAPERVRDLSYGTVLYEYYQGNAFDALSRLSVAAERGGIQGHGTNPRLVEGGLMLAYGMTRNAKALFEQVLTDDVSPSKRNQAWFYLGKVLYLEQDRVQAADALEHVEGIQLQDDEPELYDEWLYLKGQLALQQGQSALAGILADFADESLWRAYLVYNQAVKYTTDGQSGAAIDVLIKLTSDLHESLTGNPEHDNHEEALALREQTLLTLGQLQLQQGQFGAAQGSFRQIRLDSVFSDQALFHYAVAASNDKAYGIALQALTTLQNRRLFTPWLQQVPYARGFVFEQLNDDQQALEAYRAAADHYQALAGQLAQERQALSEARITAALTFNDSGPESGSSSRPPSANRLTLADVAIHNDAYGRLEVQPTDFSLAILLATEAFQLSLRDLHELYRLQRSLTRWQQQLSSFGVMLDTREQQRAVKIAQTRAALAAQQADEWQSKQADYNRQIKQAVADEDIAFFMSDEQKAFHQSLSEVSAELAKLPDDEGTSEQRAKFRRIKAYFDWWVADDYGVNRWAAQKQMQGLNQAMDEFIERKAVLTQEMASDDQHAALAQRVRRNQQRLENLRIELKQALDEARQGLLAQVKAELTRQEQEVNGYLRAARQAQARLSDALYRASTTVPNSSDDTGGKP